MKVRITFNRYLIRFKYIIILLSLVATSCSIEKRLYMPGYYIDIYNRNHTSNPHLVDALKMNDSKIKLINKSITLSAFSTDTMAVQNIDEYYAFAGNSENISPNISIAEFDNNLLFEKNHTMPNLLNQPEKANCDTIVLWSGEKIVAFGIEIGIQYKIKYKNCDDPEGIVRSVNKPMVSHIIRQNGKVERISDSKPKEGDKQNKIIEPLSVFALLFCLVGLFFYGMLFGIGAIVAGLISLIILSVKPSKYKGTFLAIIGILIGTLLVFSLFPVF